MRKRIAALVLGVLGLAGCGGDGGSVSRDALGDEWPFTVDTGTLSCKDYGGGAKAVIFETGGKEYAVNGTARSKGYLKPEPIWADDPALPFAAKKDIGPIIERGLKLCT